MFEEYINELRLLRRKASVLNSNDFHHLRTLRDPAGALATVSGWSLWIAGTSSERIALSWPWGLIEPGIPAIDPLQIQSNLMLLDDANQFLREYQALAVLVKLVNQLTWHEQAYEASRIGPSGM